MKIKCGICVIEDMPFVKSWRKKNLTAMMGQNYRCDGRREGLKRSQHDSQSLWVCGQW